MVFAAIAPHGGIAIAEACRPDERSLNDPPTAVAPMDWGVLVPLWFMGGRAEPPVPALIVAPARELPASDHVTAGAAIAAAADASKQRVAFIASADHGHAHRVDGPYGFHPDAAKYDAMVADLVRTNRLEELVRIDRELVERAKADSLVADADAPRRDPGLAQRANLLRANLLRVPDLLRHADRRVLAHGGLTLRPRCRVASDVPRDVAGVADDARQHP